MKHALPIATLLLAVFAAAPARAQQQPEQAAAPQALTVTAENRTAGNDERPGGVVRPGDVLGYRLTFTNVTERAVRGVVLANPIADGVRYVSGSARADRDDARAEYSADGGRTWSERPTEEVIVDGRTERRPVDPARYTHVRWTIDGWVQPGATVVAEFSARIPAPGETGAAEAPADPAAAR